jgi:MATE family multidrug resistance protein
MTRLGLRRGVRRIAPLAWPVFVGQVAVIAFSTVDTVMVARTSAIDLAALAVGASVYISIFVGFMGTVLAVGPIAGQLYGAGKLLETGHEAQQAAWLGLALAVPGCLLLLAPEPFLALARSEPAVAARVRQYLDGLAFALPPALVFTAFRGFNVAVSRPKAVMALQLGGLALKVRSTPCSSSGSTRRRRSARCTCRRSASPAAASRRRSSCGASSPARSPSCAATASIAASASAAA